MKFSINLGIIISTFLLLFLISMLLDWKFIRMQIIRQILIYILMLVIAAIAFRILVIINKPPKKGELK